MRFSRNICTGSLRFNPYGEVTQHANLSTLSNKQNEQIASTSQLMNQRRRFLSSKSIILKRREKKELYTHSRRGQHIKVSG